MGENDSVEKLQQKIRDLEKQLAETSSRLQYSGIELEANEGLLKLAMDDMRRIYENLLDSQSKLMQSDKLATIGLLTAGIVHEINNPIFAVKLAFSLLDTHLAKLRKLAENWNVAEAAELAAILKSTQEFVEQGNRCVDTMGKIVSDIRMFSRSDKGVMNEENVNNIIDSVIGIVWNSVKNKVTIRKEYGDLPKIRCNAQQLSQVFLNLIVNASQAIGDKPGEITLRTEKSGDKVRVFVSDTGSGMPKEVMEKIFEAFFTTKDAEQGTGLGLSITHDIVKKHNGAITVESEVGKGTTFTVSLPAGVSP